MKLTDTMRIVLADAAQRDDGAVILPDRLKGGAAKKLVQSLLSAELLEEIDSVGPLPVWRRDAEEKPFALIITEQGLEAIGVSPDEGRPPSPTAEASRSPAAEPRGKLARVVELLRRPEGASIAAMIEVTDWLPHSTRAALTGLRKKGFEIGRRKASGGSVYFIAATKEATARSRNAARTRK